MPFDPATARRAFDPATAKPAQAFDPSSAQSMSSTLADFLSAPDAGTTESSPLTMAPPQPASSTVVPLPKSDLDFIAQQAPDEPPAVIGAAPATVPRFGDPGTVTRGVSDTLGGLAEWALNKPEEAIATLTPLAPAIAIRYAPEIAVQFGKDVAAGVRGDREALGRALTMGALVGGPKAFARARESYLLRGEPAVAPERPADVAAQAQQPGAPALTGRDLRYLATTREPVIEEASRVVPAALEAVPGEVIAPDLVRTEEAKGVTERPPVGIDITNEVGVRFGPEFWSFEPSTAVKERVPLAASALKGGGEALGREVGATRATATGSNPTQPPEEALGFFRASRQDPSLRVMSDEEFATYRKNVTQQLENTETLYDEREFSQAEKAAMGQLQDKYEAAQLEKYRRDFSRRANEEVFHELLNLTDSLDPREPLAKLEGKPAFQQVSILKDVLEKRTGREGELAGEWFKRFLTGSADAREVYAGRYQKVRELFAKLNERQAVRRELPATPSGTPPTELPITGMGAATPSEFVPPPQITSNKNAVTAAERTALNLPPAFEPVRRSDPEVWAQAKAKIDDDMTAPDKLLATLRENPRAVTDVENHVLLYRHGELKNAYNLNDRALNQAVDDGRIEDAANLRAIRADLSGKLLDTFNVLKVAGTETARGLRARQAFIDQNFDLASMVTERRAVNNGRPLTERQAQETAQIQADISRAQKKATTRPSTEADYELDRVKKKWNEKLAQDAEANAGAPVRALHKVSGALGDLRALGSAFDVSALLRQGKLALASRPTSWAKSIAPSLRALTSPLAQFAADQKLRSRPNARSGLYARAGLELTEVAGKLTAQEEAFLTRGIAHKLPGVKASERAYVTFLNQLRANLFDTFAATLGKPGAPLTLPEAKVIANYVNVNTGRGDLGKAAAAGELLSTAFWSPRWVTSRFQMLLAQPIYYGALSGKVGWREGARARQLVAGEYARMAIGLGVLYGLAYAAFGPDSSDAGPYSTDFAKLVQGRTRFDPWAGLQQSTVLLDREIFGKTTSLSGKTTSLRPAPYGKPTALSTIGTFLRAKLAPAPAAVADALQGETVTGEPVTPASALLNLTVPIAWKDVLKLMEDQGVERGVALQILQLMGEGINTYSPRTKRAKQ